MSTITMKVEINSTDVPLYKALFKKMRAKKVIFEEKEENYIPNIETIKAIEEGDTLVKNYKKGFVKGYSSAETMFNDILKDDE